MNKDQSKASRKIILLTCGVIYYVTNRHCLTTKVEIGIAMFHVDVKIQCDKSTKFYLQHENDGIEWFILLIESSNCIGKQAFSPRGMLNEANEAMGKKHLMMCHAIIPLE